MRLFAMQTGALAAVVCAAGQLTAVARALAETGGLDRGVDGGLEGSPIARVGVAGVRRVEADAVRAIVRSRAGGALSSERVSGDVRAVWEMGLFDDVRAGAERRPDGQVALTFEVVERPSVRKVLVSGNRDVELDDLQPAIRLRRGRPLDRRALAATREAIRALYEAKGYLLTSVEVGLQAQGGDEDEDEDEQVGFSARGLDPSLALAGGELRAADLFRSGLTSSITGSLQYDTRDDRLFPARAASTPRRSSWRIRRSARRTPSSASRPARDTTSICPAPSCSGCAARSVW